MSRRCTDIRERRSPRREPVAVAVDPSDWDCTPEQANCFSFYTQRLLDLEEVSHDSE